MPFTIRHSAFLATERAGMMPGKILLILSEFCTAGENGAGRMPRAEDTLPERLNCLRLIREGQFEVFALMLQGVNNLSITLTATYRRRKAFCHTKTG